MRLRSLALPIVVLFTVGAANAAEPPPGPSPTTKRVLTKVLPDLAGKEVVIVEGAFPPGASSPPHRHNANTFVYVLEGALVLAIAGGAEVTVNAGETFYESPTDVHTVARNASTTATARFLVFFIKDVGAPVTSPAQ